MFEKIFKGLERAHGCTKVSAPAENGVKLKGQSFVVRQPVTTDLWEMHLNGKQSLGIIPRLCVPFKCIVHSSVVTG